MAGLERRSKEPESEECAGSEPEDDGLHGGRMKPLSSLDSSAKKCLHIPPPHHQTPSQVHSLTRRRTKARYNTSPYGDGRSRTRFKRMHSRSKKCVIQKAANKKACVSPNWIEEMSNREKGNKHCKPAKIKDIDCASNVTCEGLETRLNSNENSVSRSLHHADVACNDDIKPDITDLDLECVHGQLSHAHYSGASSTDSAKLDKNLVKQENASKNFYATDSKMLWSQFFRERASDISNLGLTKAGSSVEQMGILNPGIINRMRDRKQVHEALGTFVGAPITVDSSPEKLPLQGRYDVEIHEERPAKRRRYTAWEMEPPRMDCFSSLNFATPIPLMDVKTLAPHITSEQNAHSGGNFQTVSRTANVAACWLDLLRLDINGRLSALKRSRRRIQNMVVSGEDGGSKRESKVNDWRSFFLNTDAMLHSEGAKLVSCLKQISKMQSRWHNTSSPST